MSNSTTFVDYSSSTPITAAWLNDVNTATFTTLPLKATSTVLAASTGAALMGWHNNGSTALTVEQGLDILYKGIINVTNPAYSGGAELDGTTDDTAAIQAAVTAAAGRYVYIPYGTALITSSIELSDSTNTNVYRPAPKIIGDGMYKTRLLDRVAGNIFTHTQTAAQATASSFSRGLKFRDFDVYTDGSSPSNARGVFLSGAYYPEISDCLFYGLKGNAVETLNSTIYSNSDNFSCATVTMTRVVITACNGWGVLSTNFSDDFLLDNCYITANYGGFCAVSSGNRIRSGAVAGNSISGNTGATVAVSSITWASKLVTVTNSASHGYTTGDSVLINGNSTTAWCGVHRITVTGLTTFTYPLYTDPGSTGGTTTTMQLSGGIIFGYQGGSQSMNNRVEYCEIQVNGPRQIWLMSQNSVVDHCRIIDDDQGTATFHSPVQIDIGNIKGCLSDANKITNCHFRLSSASGTPAVTLVRANLGVTDGTQTCRYNTVEGYQTGITGSPTVTALSITNSTNTYAVGNHINTQILPKGSSSVGTTTKNIADASGNQTITGLPFRPTSVTIQGFSGAMFSSGYCDTSLVNTSSYYYPTGITWGDNSPAVLNFRTGAGDYMTGTIDHYTDDGFVIAWVKTGVPTGTATIQFTCLN